MLKHLGGRVMRILCDKAGKMIRNERKKYCFSNGIDLKTYAAAYGTQCNGLAEILV